MALGWSHFRNSSKDPPVKVRTAVQTPVVVLGAKFSSIGPAGSLIEVGRRQVNPPFFKDGPSLFIPRFLPHISYGNSKENLSKYQDVLSLVIVSFILST